MTTITYPTSGATSVLLGILAGALGMLILVAALAIGAMNAPAITTQPEAAPAPMTNQANSDDLTPNSGVLEFAD